MEDISRREFEELTRRVNRLEHASADHNIAIDQLRYPATRRDPDGTLPRESDAVQAARLAAHNLSVAQVEAAREARGLTGAHALSPSEIAATRAERLGSKAATRADVALFVLGLRELRDMLNYGRERAITPADIDGVMRAAIARIGGMLDAWGAELSALPPDPAE